MGKRKDRSTQVIRMSHMGVKTTPMQMRSRDLPSRHFEKHNRLMQSNQKLERLESARKTNQTEIFAC
jgi:hypothetical protein